MRSSLTLPICLLALFLVFTVTACTNKVITPEPQSALVKQAEILKSVQILGVQYQSFLESNPEAALKSKLRCRLNESQELQASAEESLKTLVTQENRVTLKAWASAGPAESLTELQVLQWLDPKLSESTETYELMKKMKSQIKTQYPIDPQDLKPGNCF